MDEKEICRQCNISRGSTWSAFDDALWSCGWIQCPTKGVQGLKDVVPSECPYMAERLMVVGNAEKI